MNMNPGVYPNIPFAEYLTIEAMSNSYLGRLDKCPAAALVTQEETPALILGRAVHKLVLEGQDAFRQEYAISPQFDRRTSIGKAQAAQFEAENHGQIIIAEDAGMKIRAIANAVYRHPWAKKLLDENVTEQTVIWTDRETGLLCKARPDAVPDEGKLTLIDLKTTSDASEGAFTRSIIKYGYARGAAFYLDGFNAARGTKLDAFIHIAVETAEPYRTEIYLLDDDFIAWGREQYERLLVIEKECRAKNEYPHYSRAYTTINKPAWL